jgi:hypothetical protein
MLSDIYDFYEGKVCFCDGRKWNYIYVCTVKSAHFESKEWRGKAWALRHGLHRLQST